MKLILFIYLIYYIYNIFSIHGRLRRVSNAFYGLRRNPRGRSGAPVGVVFESVLSGIFKV